MPLCYFIQSTTTREIAASVSQVSESIGNVNDNINQGSLAILEISGEIEQLGQTYRDISSKSYDVNDNAEELALLSQQQNKVVGKFKI